jgi:hypothetical protein
MITKTRTCGSFGPKRSYFFPIDNRDEDRPMTKQMKRTLTDLIYQTMNEAGRERLLSQLSDMTQAEAQEMIFDIRTANWGNY